METCRIGDREICSYSLKDETGIYYQDQVIQLKRSAAHGQLICSDCGQRVYLAAGLIKEPYFAHYDVNACTYGAQIESEESKLGKRLLYNMLMRSFPNVEIKTRYRLDNGRYTSFFIQISEEIKLAFDYQLVQLPIKILDERCQYYKDHHIIPVFLLGVRQDKNSEQLSWYQNCVQNILGYCIFFHAYEEKIILKRSFHYEEKQFREHRLYEQSYPISSLKIMADGGFECDFLESCYQKEETIRAGVKQRIMAKEKEEIRQQEYIQKQRENDAQLELALFKQRLQRLDFSEMELPPGIRRDILLSCVNLICEEEIELVSQKYLKFLWSKVF